MAAFDPYHRWLGIPPDDQPPDHYRLLGLARYESDADVIENAANQRMAHLRSFQTGPYSADSQRLLNEVASARICLLNLERKASYDTDLRRAESPPAIPAAPPPAPAGPAVPQPPPAGSLSPPRIESGPKVISGGPGDQMRRDHQKRPRISRGTLLALVGSTAALVLVVVVALLREHPPQATLGFDLGRADRQDIQITIDGVEQSLPLSGPLEFACEPGRRTVRIQRPGYEPFETAVAVTAGEPIEIAPEFVPVAGATAKDDGQEPTPMSPEDMPSPPEATVTGTDAPPPDTNPPSQTPDLTSIPQAVQKALAALEGNPDDAGANAIVCHWFLVDKDDPEQAFPYMAKMQHKSLSPLAMRELEPPSSAEEQASLGDGWWDHAEAASDPALEKAFRARAVHWYQKARPGLTSVAMLEKIAHRLGEEFVAPDRPEEQAEWYRQLPEGLTVSKGQWIDLLGSVNFARDVSRGAWQLQGPMVSSTDPGSAMMFPVAIEGDYELEIQFSHIAGPAEGLTIAIPVGSHACNVFLPFNRRTDVLNNVNGGPYIVSSISPLEPQRPATAKIRVTTQNEQKQITVLVNGAPYFQWQGDEASLACEAAGQLSRINQPGVIVSRGQYALQAARMQLLDGQARQIAAPSLPPHPYLLTGDVPGESGDRRTVFEDFAPSSAVLVGMRYMPGGIGLMGLQPIYRDATGQVHDGTWFGGPVRPDNSAIAKDGYAVGALVIETRNPWLSGVSLRFFRLGNSSLDPSDSYDSPLLGEAGIGKPVVVETRGRPAVGLHGLWNPGQITSLGLITARPTEEQLWRKGEDDARWQYVSLLDLEPLQCAVAETRFSRRLGVGACNPDDWPIVDENSLSCPEFLYAPAPSRLTWKLTPAVKSFTAMGYCIESRAVQFRVLVDGQMVYSGQQAGVEEIRVDLPRGEVLELQVDDMGGSTGDESYWLYPRVHSRPAANVAGLDDKESRSNMLAVRPPLSQEVAPRPNSHQPLRPLYPVGGRCREFLYAHPPSRIVYEVPPGSKRFSAIGYCIGSKSVRFRVSVNGKEAYSGQPAGIEAVQIQLPRQAKTLELWIDPSRGRSAQDQAFWCFPRFYR